LQQSDTLLGVGLRLGKSNGVGLKTIHQRKAGGIVRAGVDLRTGRQLLQHGVQSVSGVIQVVFRIHRGEIIQDTQGHGVLLVGCVDLRFPSGSAPDCFG
jgi:hypothetical protein